MGVAFRLAITMAKLNVFHVMIPSIYSTSQNCQKKEVKLHHKRTKKYKASALICGISALLALLLTLIVFFHKSSLSSNSKVRHRDTTNHITYVRKHPRNINKLDNKDVFISVKTTAKN